MKSIIWRKLWSLDRTLDRTLELRCHEVVADYHEWAMGVYYFLIFLLTVAPSSSEMILMILCCWNGSRAHERETCHSGAPSETHHHAQPRRVGSDAVEGNSRFV